jgi:hypothetical protein
MDAHVEPPFITKQVEPGELNAVSYLHTVLCQDAPPICQRVKEMLQKKKRYPTPK